MRNILIISGFLLLCSCLPAPKNEKPAEWEMTGDYVKIFAGPAHIISNSDNEKLVIEKDGDNNKVRILLIVDEKGEKTAVKVENIDDYIPWFSAYDKTSVSLESLFLLDCLNGMAGLHDIDNDGTDEFYFIYYGASDEGLVVMDYIDNTLKVTGRVDGFVGFLKTDDAIYMLSKHIRVGPKLCSTEVNDYVAHSYEAGNIIKFAELPGDVYNALYEKIYSKYEKDKNFYYLFFFLYNNNPGMLSYKYIDEHFKSDPRADKKYINKENVRKLVDDPSGDKSFDIYQTKYYYYYLVDTLQ